MDARIKKLWVDALRSGEYEQGTSCLRSEDGRMCCLGVLCDLYTKDGNWGAWEEPSHLALGRLSVHGETAILPIQVSKWAGLNIGLEENWASPTLQSLGAISNMSITKETYHSCSSANDLGFTFAQIADAIETDL
jgi:hypothetical protein